MKHDIECLIDLLERICGPICKYKKDLKITPTETLGRVIFSIACHNADFAKLIGSQGRVSRGLTEIVRQTGRNVGHKTFELSFVSPPKVIKEMDASFKSDPEFPTETIRELIFDAVHLMFGSDEHPVSVTCITVDQRSIFEVDVDDAYIPPNIAKSLSDVFHIYGNAVGRKTVIECATREGNSF